MAVNFPAQLSSTTRSTPYSPWKMLPQQTPQECVAQKRNHYGDKDQGLQSGSTHHSALWLWVYQCYARKMNHFHTTSLRKLHGIEWQDKIPDTEVSTFPVSILSRCRSSFAEQAMQFAYQTFSFPRNSRSANSSMANATLGARRSAPKTLSKCR